MIFRVHYFFVGDALVGVGIPVVVDKKIPYPDMLQLKGQVKHADRDCASALHGNYVQAQIFVAGGVLEILDSFAV